MPWFLTPELRELLMTIGYGVAFGIALWIMATVSNPGPER